MLCFFSVWLLLHLFCVCSFAEYSKCFESPQRQQQQKISIKLQFNVGFWWHLGFCWMCAVTVPANATTFRCVLDVQCDFTVFFFNIKVCLDSSIFQFASESVPTDLKQPYWVSWLSCEKIWNLLAKINTKHVLFRSCAHTLTHFWVNRMNSGQFFFSLPKKNRCALYKIPFSLCVCVF